MRFIQADCYEMVTSLDVCAYYYQGHGTVLFFQFTITRGYKVCDDFLEKHLSPSLSPEQINF